jgi:hypothetical protein
LAFGPNWQGNARPDPSGEVDGIRPGKRYGVSIATCAVALAKKRAAPAKMDCDIVIVISEV